MSHQVVQTWALSNLPNVWPKETSEWICQLFSSSSSSFFCSAGAASTDEDAGTSASAFWQRFLAEKPPYGPAKAMIGVPRDSAHTTGDAAFTSDGAPWPNQRLKKTTGERAGRLAQ